MSYTKPVLVNLGNPLNEVRGGCTKPCSNADDGATKKSPTAYEADE